MQPRTKIGLIVGVIALVLNICVAGLMGICGPLVSLIAGGIAGLLAAQQEKPATKNEGSRVGATAGGIAGGLVILGQILGGVGALLYFQTSGRPIFGQTPNLGAPGAQLGYYAGGFGVALCFGIVGAALAAGAGALAAYLATPDRPVVPPPSENITIS